LTPPRTEPFRLAAAGRLLCTFVVRLSLFHVAFSCVSLEDQEPAAAQRPTLSSDTATTAPETIELETGVDVEPGGSYLWPVTLKYGAGGATEVFATLSALQRIEGPGGSERGTGDLVLGTRHRFLEADGARPSLAVEPAVKLPVSSHVAGSLLSSGETDFLLAGMATWTGKRVAGNLYYQLGLLGDPSGPGLQIAHLPALAGSVKVGRGFSVFGEVAGVLVPEQDVESGFGTLGATWSPHPEIIFDAGVRAGIGDDTPDAVYFVGLTWNLGHPSVGK